MALSKEQILTLTCLKEVGVKGVGTQKVFAIANAISKRGILVNSYEALSEVMSSMKEKAIQKVTLYDLQNAYQCAERIIEESEADHIGLVGYFDDDFPDTLRNTINEEGKAAPPLLLWYRGDLSIAQMPGLAVIGTREPTPEGVSAGEFLSGAFAKLGFNIVSGLAVGCDSSGHRGALKVGGKTTVFLANGLDYDSIYPPENRELAEEIVEKGGLLLSEYRIGSNVNRYNLVARDRLQAGLSLATLVIQTGEKGGTLHAAMTTLKANKPLYVVKFKDDDTNNQEKCLGNAYLVKHGATYINGSDKLDLISEYIKNRKPVKTSLF